MKAQLSEYEERALREIYRWKNPPQGRWPKVMKALNWPVDKVGDLALDSPVLGDAIRKSVEGLMAVCNDLAQWSVQPEVIYADFRKAGHSSINGPADVFSIDLEHADRVVGWLSTRYKALAFGEGAACGVAGLPGIPADIVALITLNMRALGEYAAYYGFDMTFQGERLFAVSILGLAASPTDGSKGLAMTELARIAGDVAKKRTWKELEQHQFVYLIQQIAKALGVRLTKAKLAQIIPATGAAVGGGFNAYFTGKVCDAGYYLYRERFLVAKYGPEIAGGLLL